MRRNAIAAARILASTPVIAGTYYANDIESSVAWEASVVRPDDSNDGWNVMARFNGPDGKGILAERKTALMLETDIAAKIRGPLTGTRFRVKCRIRDMSGNVIADTEPKLWPVVAGTKHLSTNCLWRPSAYPRWVTVQVLGHLYNPDSQNDEPWTTMSISARTGASLHKDTAGFTATQDDFLD
jgi:hypothetical protein